MQRRTEVTTPDVLIIGAGLAGSSLAWQLAGPQKVLILEKGEQPGAEASGQNAGMVRRMVDDPIERALALRSFAFFEEPGEDWEAAPPSRRVGAFLGAMHEPHELYDAAAYLRGAGGRVEACDRPGEVAPALADAALLSGWYLPDERVADAHSMLLGFLGGARRRGATLRCGVQVTDLLLEGERVIGVKTSEGDIEAGQVVLAAGAWSGVLAAGAGLERPLVPVARTLLVSDAHPLSRPDHPWCWLEDVGLYVRPEAEGWLCSPCDERPQWPAPGASSWGALEERRCLLAAAKLQHYLPALGDMSVRGGWMGLRTFAPDRRPLMGADPERTGLWWAAGLGGFGVTCSAAIGEAVAAWMKGDEVAWLDQASVAPGRRMSSRWLIHPDGDRRRGRLIASTPPQERGPAS